MKKTLWNEGWSVAPGVPNPFGVVFGSEAKPVPVSLPQDMMILEERDEKAASGNQTGYYPVKSYTFTKSFFVPEKWSQKQITLEFEGVMARAAVYVNGELAAKNRYGYSQFFVNLNPYLTYGQMAQVQVLALSQENASRWYPGAGIYRDVWIYEGDLLHIEPEGVRLTTKSIGDYALLEAEISVVNASHLPRSAKLRLSLTDKEGKVSQCENVLSLLPGESQRAHMLLYVDDPRLWSPENPELYSWKAELIGQEGSIDAAEGYFGIRTLTADARGGLRINGVETKLRGACIHHDNGIIGATTLPDAELFRLGKLKEVGFNAIRSAHHPAGKALLDACDALGILVMDELTDVWEMPKNSGDYFMDFTEEWEVSLRRMVEKDYNHPCVILYSLGNEINEIGRRNGGRRNRMMANALREMDASRLVTGAISGFLAMMDQIEEIGKSMDEAEAAAKAAAERDSSGSEALNAAISQMDKTRMDAFATSDALSEAMEEVSCELDVVGYNYLTARHELEARRHSGRVVVGSETFPTEIARLWDIVKRNPHVIGDFTWTGYDYLGEAGIACYHYAPERTEQGWYPDRLAYSGDINLNGYRRPVSYLREIAYGRRKEPFLAVERVDRYGCTDRTNDWKYVDGLDSWTFTGYEGKQTLVHVLTASEEAELFLNGKSLGRKPAGADHGFDVSFMVTYEPGELLAVGYTGGKEDGRVLLTTAGEPVSLKVEVSRDTLTADGRGLALFTVDLLDAKGTVNRFAKRQVRVSVSGAGFLAGFGSANPSCEGSYQQDTWETFDGRVMAAVRAGFQAGEIVVAFRCEGCPEERIRLTVE